MGKREENTAFQCIACKEQVRALKNGTYRNHCPLCLASLHVDSVIPGDRKSTCWGVMKPLRLKFNPKKGWQIVHKCLKCSVEKTNKIAVGDDQSDDWILLVSLSQKSVRINKN